MVAKLLAVILAANSVLWRRAAAEQQSSDLPDVGVVGVPAVKAWARQRIGKAEREFMAAGLPRQPSPPSWEGVVVYEIQTDRFNNGNLSNDVLNRPDWQTKAMGDKDLSGMPDWRHGGDIQGIRDRLGYIADLGVQVIWVTPLLHHKGSYHGYCTSDPTTTDPGFGTPEELRSFVHEAHEHGIQVVLDIVINHMCGKGTHYIASREHNHTQCADSLAANFWLNTSAIVGQAHLNFSKNFFPPFRADKFFNRCGGNNITEMNTLSLAAVFGDLTGGMFDYRTDDVDFQEIFTDLHKYWIAYADVDGFRLDAAKHVTQDFLAYFSVQIRAYAQSLGKQDFFLLGETVAPGDWISTTLGKMTFPTSHWGFTGEPAALMQRREQLHSTLERFPVGSRYPGLTSSYNVGLSKRVRSGPQCFNSTKLPHNWFHSLDAQWIMTSGVPFNKLWTMVEIHDWARMLVEFPSDTGMLKSAIAFLMSMPGSPILYYGVEQGFNGKCPDFNTSDGLSSSAVQRIKAICESTRCKWHGPNRICLNKDSLKRQDMFVSGPWRLGSAEPHVNGLAHVGEPGAFARVPWQQDPMLPRDHDMYAFVRRWTYLRRSCSALAAGKFEWLSAHDMPCQLMAMARFHEGVDGSDVFVIINPGGNKTVDVPRLSTQRSKTSKNAGARYLNVFDTSDVAVADDESDNLELLLENPTTEAGEVRAYVREDQLEPFDGGLGFAPCAKTANAEEEEVVKDASSLRGTAVLSSEAAADARRRKYPPFRR